MAESQTEFDQQQFANSLDAGMKNIMPDSWLGHARMRIHERGFDPERREKAEQAAATLLAKRDDVTARYVGEVVIQKFDEKLGYL